MIIFPMRYRCMGKYYGDHDETISVGYDAIYQIVETRLHELMNLLKDDEEVFIAKLMGKEELIKKK